MNQLLEGEDFVDRALDLPHVGGDVLRDILEHRVANMFGNTFLHSFDKDPMFASSFIVQHASIIIYIGEKVGTGRGDAVDIAVDPIEGTRMPTVFFTAGALFSAGCVTEGLCQNTSRNSGV